MPMFLIQSAILIAIAFVIGCIIGCLFKRMFASEEVSVPVAAASVATAAVAAAPMFEPEPAPAKAPEPEPQPVAVMAPVVRTKPKPKAKAAPKPKAVAAPARPDDLKLIVGIGPVNERKLNAVGVSRFAQIASWTPKDEAAYGERLEFPGRIEREEWVRQARKLADGGTSEDKGELARRSGAAKPASLKGAAAVKSAKPAAAKPAAIKLAAVKPAAAKPAAAKPAAAKPAAVKPAAAKPAAVKTAAAKPVAAKASAAKAAPAKAPVAKPAATKAAVAKMPAKTAPAKPAPAKKPMAVKLAKPVGGKPDNLTLINGIGNVIEKKLHAMGVYHFEQIANWSKAQAEDFSKAIGFPGRAEREGWMKEAAVFMKGGTTDHARKVEAGAIPSSRKSTAAEKGKSKK